MVARAVLVVAVAGAIAAAASAATGSFYGPTSQGAPDYTVSFRAVGGHVKGFHITWRGRCVSQQQIFLSTSQGSARIAVRHSGWSAHWSYRGKVPYASDVTGRFTVDASTGHFSGKRARGTFRVHVTLYAGKTVNDRCHSGPITWSATRT